MQGSVGAITSTLEEHSSRSRHALIEAVSADHREGTVFLNLVLLGIAVTLEPFPLTAFILLLAAKKGTLKGVGFILGWLACLVLVIGIVVLVTGGKPPAPKSAPTIGAVIVKLLLGLLLIGVGVRQYRRRSIPRKPPTWMEGLDKLSPLTAAGLAVFLQPWTLVAAAAATVVDANLAKTGDFLALFFFCLLATSSFLIMELSATFAPEAAGERLRRLRDWINSNQNQAIVVLSLLIGLWLVGTSLYTLAT